MSKTIYDEALADAKQLKALAEDNAKKAVLDAVTPKIKELIERQLLDENEYDSVEEDNVNLFHAADADINANSADDNKTSNDYALEVLALEEELSDIARPFKPQNIKDLKNELSRVTDRAEALEESLLKTFESLQAGSINERKRSLLESRLEDLNKKLHLHKEETMTKLKNLFEKKISIELPDDKNVDELTAEDLNVVFEDEEDMEDTGMEEPGEGEDMEGMDMEEPGEGEDMESMDMEEPGEEEEEEEKMNESYDDDTVIEISESMLRSEISKLRNRRLMESEMNYGFSDEEEIVDLDKVKLNASDGKEGRTSIPTRKALKLEMAEVEEEVATALESALDEMDEADYEEGYGHEMDEEGMDELRLGHSPESDRAAKGRYVAEYNETDHLEEAKKSHAAHMKEAQKHRKECGSLKEKAAACKEKAKMCEKKGKDAEAKKHHAEAKRCMEKASACMEKAMKCERMAKEAKARDAKKEKMNEAAEYFAVRESELKEKLEESNLFNAKLLCCNKLLQNESLTARQKAAAIERLDEAETVREVKLVYESIIKALGRDRGTVNESARGAVGSSSRPVRTSGAVLTESTMVDRWAKLAGIK